MAHASDAKGGQMRTAAAKRPTSRAVKPVIPLPHLKRQNAAAAAKLAKSRDKNNESVQPSPKSDETRDGGAVEEKVTDIKFASKPGSQDTANGTSSMKPETKTASMNHGTTEGDEVSNTNVDQPEAQASITSQSNTESRSSIVTDKSAEALSSTSPVSSTQYHLDQSPTSGHSRDIVPIMGLQNGEHASFNINGQLHMYQPHASHGDARFSLIHGGFGSPVDSSYARHVHSPPGLPGINGQAHFMTSASSGPPPMMQTGAERMTPVPHPADGYNRPNVVLPPAEAYRMHTGTAGGHTGASTPQNSQPLHRFGKPIEGVYHPYQNFHDGIPNHGHGAYQPPHDPRAHVSGGLTHAGLVPPFGNPHSSSNNGLSHNLVSFIQNAWRTGKYVDCLFEIRFQNRTPVRFPAHHVILAQSSLLEKLLHEQGQASLPYSNSPRPPFTLFVNADDRWVRPATLELALQNMYGYPLLPMNNLPQDESVYAGTRADRFHFALSYLASGIVLGWEPVVRRGTEIAAQLVDMETVETAMAFAMAGHVDCGSYDGFEHGEASKVILDRVTDLVGGHLPPGFQINPTVTCADWNFSRLPLDSPSTSNATPNSTQNPTQNSKQETSTIEVRGNAMAHLRAESQSQRPLHIQFGDLSTSGAEEDDESSQPLKSPSQVISHDTVSRILLNLPFTYLQKFVESGPEDYREYRYRIAREAVGEREARRIRAVGAVLEGKLAGSRAAETALRNPEPQGQMMWGVLGWREGTDDSTWRPSLTREWCPLQPAQPRAAAAYP